MVELSDVLRRYGTEYLQKFGEIMLSSHRRAFKDILRCHTPTMIYTHVLNRGGQGVRSPIDSL